MSHSRVVYFEIPASNPVSCMEFYRKVFGWEFSQLESERYWLTKTGPDELPGINGAVRLRPDETRCVVNTLNVKDIKLTSEAVIRYGGQIVLPKTALPAIGWLMYFKDPEGNLHGALQPDATAR